LRNEEGNFSSTSTEISVIVTSERVGGMRSLGELGVRKIGDKNSTILESPQCGNAKSYSQRLGHVAVAQPTRSQCLTGAKLQI
jgi:hypothetical protein